MSRKTIASSANNLISGILGVILFEVLLKTSSKACTCPRLFNVVAQSCTAGMNWVSQENPARKPRCKWVMISYWL